MSVLDRLTTWWTEPEKNFDSLYRESIHLEEEGKLDAAIERLRAALQKAHESSHVTSTLEQHLRLPLLLQRTGRFQEARQALSQLLAHGYPGQLKLPGIEWVERSIVYDKMHLAFKREGRPKEALVYGVLSFVASAYAHYLDMARLNYEEDMARIRSRATHEAVAEDLLSATEVDLPPGELATAIDEAIDQFDVEPGERITHDLEMHLRDWLLDAPMSND